MPEREFVKYFHPRVERSAQMSLYTRGQADSRPASVAHPSQFGRSVAGSQWGSVALGETVTHSLLQSASLGMQSSLASGDSTALKASRAIPVGEKRNIFRVQREGDNEYRFEQKGRTLDPGRGVILDTDRVTDVIDKLHDMYPVDMPRFVHMGDAVAHGVAPSRMVRTVLESRGKALLEAQPIGEQCLRSVFSGYFHARAERVARVNIAARARSDGRMDSVAFLRPSEYMERSTSRAGI